MKSLRLIFLILCSVLAIADTALAEGEYHAALSQLENNRSGEISRANKDFEYVDTQLKNNLLGNMAAARKYRDDTITNAKTAYKSSNKDSAALTRYNEAVDQAWQEYDRSQLKSDGDYTAQYVRSKNQRDSRINEANNQFQAVKSRMDKVKEKYAPITNRPAPAVDRAGYDNAIASADSRRAAAIDKATKDFENRVAKADRDLDNALNRAVDQHRSSGTGPESEAMYGRNRGMAILKNEDDWAVARNKRDADIAKIEEDYKNETAATKKKYNIDQPEPQMSPEEREAYRKELAQAMSPQPASAPQPPASASQPSAAMPAAAPAKEGYEAAIARAESEIKAKIDILVNELETTTSRAAAAYEAIRQSARDQATIKRAYDEFYAICMRANNEYEAAVAEARRIYEAAIAQAKRDYNK